MIQLRPDQLDLKQRIYNEWNAGHSNVLAIACTGFGKSIVTTDVILDGHNQGMSEVIMAHRNELVSQMSVHVARRGIMHRIIGSSSTIAGIIQEHRAEFGRSFVNPDARCAVGSVQTIVSRKAELRQWAAQIDRWTLDEAHHCVGRGETANQWAQAVEMFVNARGLGVTACPQRADGKGLGRHHDGVFDAMVVGPSMRETINMGNLADYEFSIPKSDFDIDENKRGKDGDYTRPAMREASKKSHIVGDVVAEYLKRASGRRAICFATDVETANDIAARFNAAGVSAASVSAKTDTGVRRDMIRRFKENRMSILVNVDLFDEGFDCPGADVVIMARPTASLNKYLQMAGRAMRIDHANPSKVAMIIDHVSNFKRHMMPDRPRAWTLDRRDKKAKQAPDPDDIPLTSCRECSRPYERALPACPYCGAEPPLPAPGSRTPEQVDGDLALLDLATLAAMREAMTLEAPGDMAERVKHVAGGVAAQGAANRQMARHQSQAALRQAIEQWAGCRRAKGEDDRTAHRRFYLTTGMTVLQALALPRDEMETMRATIEGWYTQ